MSDHSVYVRKFTLKPHPNADKLSLATPDSTSWQCVVRTDEFKGVTLAAYIPIETRVPPVKEFEFLAARKYRVRTIKLRGEMSQGLLIPAKSNWKEGQDVTEELGVKRYERPEDGKEFHVYQKTFKQKLKKYLRQKLRLGFAEPSWFQDHTDIENFKNYPYVFSDKDNVVITEKSDGTNWRAAWNGKFESNSNRWYIRLLQRFLTRLWGDRFIVGSHYTRKDPNSGTVIYSLMAKFYDLEAKLKKIFKGDRVIVFGEIYGLNVPNGCKKLWYGEKSPRAVLFDIKLNDKWLDWADIEKYGELLGIPAAPKLYEGPYSIDKIHELTSGPTVLGKGLHIREGIVIRPQKNEVYHNLPGQRKWLKSVSAEYHMLKDGQEEQKERYEENKELLGVKK